jgi:tetratricopeptide (TPR) repeat protein
MHLTPEELEGIVLGGMPREHARTVVLHMLRGCHACQLALAPYLLRKSLFVPSETLPDARLRVYDAPLDRAFAAATAAERKRDALDLLDLGGLNALATAPSHVSGLPLFEALLERSWALRRESTEEMVAFARAALLWSQGLREGGDWNPKEIADLRCRAWAELGNAYRVADSLDLADDAFGHATTFLVQGTGDALLSARLFEILASYYSARRSFDLACGILAMVTPIYQRLGNSHLAGRTLISRGICTGYQGKSEEAIQLIDLGLPLIEPERDSGLMYSAYQSRAWCLVDCGRFLDAQKALFEIRVRRLDVGGRLGELKLRWLDGHVNSGLKRYDVAERALGQVKEGFEEAGLGYKAALAGLELAEVWLFQNRVAEAESVALECANVFIALGIRRELLASVLVLRMAAETKCLNLAILQYTLHLLHQEDRNPATSPLEEP